MTRAVLAEDYRQVNLTEMPKTPHSKVASTSASFFALQRPREQGFQKYFDFDEKIQQE